MDNAIKAKQGDINHLFSIFQDHISLYLATLLLSMAIDRMTKQEGQVTQDCSPGFCLLFYIGV